MRMGFWWGCLLWLVLLPAQATTATHYYVFMLYQEPGKSEWVVPPVVTKVRAPVGTYRFQVVVRQQSSGDESSLKTLAVRGEFLVIEKKGIAKIGSRNNLDETDVSDTTGQNKDKSIWKDDWTQARNNPLFKPLFKKSMSGGNDSDTKLLAFLAKAGWLETWADDYHLYRLHRLTIGHLNSQRPKQIVALFLQPEEKIWSNNLEPQKIIDLLTDNKQNDGFMMAGYLEQANIAHQEFYYDFVQQMKLRLVPEEVIPNLYTDPAERELVISYIRRATDVLNNATKKVTEIEGVSKDASTAFQNAKNKPNFAASIAAKKEAATLQQFDNTLSLAKDEISKIKSAAESVMRLLQDKDTTNARMTTENMEKIYKTIQDRYVTATNLQGEVTGLVAQIENPSPTSDVESHNKHKKPVYFLVAGALLIFAIALTSWLLVSWYKSRKYSNEDESDWDAQDSSSPRRPSVNLSEFFKSSKPRNSKRPPVSQPHIDDSSIPPTSTVQVNEQALTEYLTHLDNNLKSLTHDMDNIKQHTNFHHNQTMGSEVESKILSRLERLDQEISALKQQIKGVQKGTTINQTSLDPLVESALNRALATPEKASFGRSLTETVLRQVERAIKSNEDNIALLISRSPKFRQEIRTLIGMNATSPPASPNTQSLQERQGQIQLQPKRSKTGQAALAAPNTQPSPLTMNYGHLHQETQQPTAPSKDAELITRLQDLIRTLGIVKTPEFEELPPTTEVCQFVKSVVTNALKPNELLSRYEKLSNSIEEITGQQVRLILAKEKEPVDSGKHEVISQQSATKGELNVVHSMTRPGVWCGGKVVLRAQVIEIS